MISISRSFLLECAASLLTLAGIYFGSTTTLGAGLYLFSLVFWYALCIQRKMWGLMPLNIATTVLSGINLYKSLGV